MSPKRFQRVNMKNLYKLTLSLILLTSSHMAISQSRPTGCCSISNEKKFSFFYGVEKRIVKKIKEKSKKECLTNQFTGNSLVDLYASTVILQSNESIEKLKQKSMPLSCSSFPCWLDEETAKDLRFFFNEHFGGVGLYKDAVSYTSLKYDVEPDTVEKLRDYYMKVSSDFLKEQSNNTKND